MEYFEDGDIFWLKRYFADGEALKQSADIYSEVFSCFSLEYFSFFNASFNFGNCAADRLQVSILIVIHLSLFFVIFLETLHILTSFQQFLLILSERFQENRILHLIVHLMEMRLTPQAQQDLSKTNDGSQLHVECVRVQVVHQCL